MNYGGFIFLGVFAALVSSWCGLVLAPYFQLGRQGPVEIKETGVLYPQARPGLAARGAGVYVAQGCAYCHSQEVRQSGVELNVTARQWGTNTAEVVAALQRARPELDRAGAERLVQQPPPVRLLTNTTLREAEHAIRQFQETGAEVELAPIRPLGADLERGWGRRRSVAQDYLRDAPVQPGTQRWGPDLANFGNRQTNAAVLFKRLLDPQSVMPGTVMPPYRYLFEKHPVRAGRRPSPDAIVLKENGVDYVYEPTTEARALVAYLLSLRADEILPETPMTKPPVVAAAPNGAGSAASVAQPPSP